MGSLFDRHDRRRGLARLAEEIPQPPSLRLLHPAIGLAQTGHTGPGDDAAMESEIRQIRDTPARSAPNSRRALSVPARAWIAVGVAAGLWAVVALAFLILR